MVRGSLRERLTKEQRRQVSDRRSVCHSNHCGHFGLHQRPSGCFEGCGLLAKPCSVDRLRLKIDFTGPRGRQCWPPLSEFKGRVGFIAVCYMPIGGTEVWHQTLIPRLPEVAGFVALEPTLSKGDLTRLPCPSGIGLEAAQRLAASCQTLVVWGVGHRLAEILPSPRPRVISVTHGDGTSQWSTNFMQAQAPWTDHCVYLCPSGQLSCPAGIPATLIPNAPDPQRIQPSRLRAAVRAELGIGETDRLLVVTARLSSEKRIDVLLDAASLLPAGYHLLVAGSAAAHEAEHAAALRASVRDRSRIIPAVTTPADLLAAADAVLSASTFEGYGLATAEAMLAGVPVISTPVGLLENNRHLARIVHHNAAPHEWSAAIEADFADADWQTRRAADAQRVMQTEHSVEKFASAWADLTLAGVAV